MGDPRPEEFQRFHDLLTEHAPDGYEPYYFRVDSGSKAPDLSYGSWKSESARISPEEAVEWMDQGGNVGVAGTPDDALVNVDIDDEDETSPDDLKETLIARSRSRVGSHAWYFEAPNADIPNIPTDDAGEVRANWQYVVAPGSYVETDPEDVPEEEREDCGYYTVERADPVTSLRKQELPEVFLDHLREEEQEDKDAELEFSLPDFSGDDDGDYGGASALFGITAEDVVRKEGGTTETDERWSALFHGSDTDANMSVSSQGKIQCWRHNVTHNGLQALVVLSDYSGGCAKVGTPHKGSNAGESCIKNEDGAHIWAAWRYAKRNGYIPQDDPVPYDALRHLCRERELCAVTEIPDSYEDGSLPAHAYDSALKTIEMHDDLEPGREPTKNMSSGGDSEDEPPGSDVEDGDSEPEDEEAAEEELRDELSEESAEASANSDLWDNVRSCYKYDDDPGQARVAATNALQEETGWMWVLESEKLWVYDQSVGYYHPFGEAHAHKRLESELGSHYGVAEKNEILDRLRARAQTRREDLNAKTAEKPLLCVGNGVVDLESGTLRPHDPEYKFTRGLQWDYDEQADRSSILSFFDGITKRKADRDTLIDHLAHGLMPGHPYRAFIITYGPGGNGKTQLGELLSGFVGEDNAASVELQDLTGDDDFATGALPSKFINVGDDIDVSEIRKTGTLKTATGGGTLRANEKHEKKFNFTNEAAMFFSANEPPRIAEDKDSIDDRLYPIEMPFRHVDDPDPENPYERPKEPGISDRLLSDHEAMRGLLSLVVEHAQDLIASGGQYSMPESPSERRDIYEAASDPIRRFALRYLEDGDPSDMVLKGDAYSVYTTMCDLDDERPAHEDTFKSKVSQQSIVDVEGGRTRKFSSDDSQDYCWKYVRFDSDAKHIMPDRLISRYFPGAETDDDESEADEPEPEPEPERVAFGAQPIRDAASSLTGYVTVTAEIAKTHRLGDDNDGVKAVLKDESGAINAVSWVPDLGDQLSEAEGECIVLQNAEVSEYQGTRQLSIVDGLTEIESIQQGVAYTPGGDLPEADGGSDGEGQRVQSGLEDAAEAETDGGESGTDLLKDEFSGNISTTQRDILNELRVSGDEITVATLAGKLGESPDTVTSAVDRLSTKGRVITEGEGGSMEVRLNV